MLGRKYWVESLLSEHSAKKRLAEDSTRFPVFGLLCRVDIIFQAKDARQISASCLETSAPEAVRGEGNSSCPNLEPTIRSSGLICPNLRPIYHEKMGSDVRTLKVTSEQVFRWRVSNRCEQWATQPLTNWEVPIHLVSSITILYIVID